MELWRHGAARSNPEERAGVGAVVTILPDDTTFYARRHSFQNSFYKNLYLAKSEFTKRIVDCSNPLAIFFFNSGAPL
jgi:hypothetical protein